MAAQSSAMIGGSWTDVSVLGNQVFGQALMDSCGPASPVHRLRQCPAFGRAGCIIKSLVI